MLSKQSKYGLRALIYLARHSQGKPVLISEIAQREKMPRKFLERILLDLKKRGVLQSRMGKGGGYILARRPEQITVAEIIRLTDGPLAPVPCVSQTAYAKCPDCNDEETCCIRVVMKEVRDGIALILDRTSLADMLAKQQALEAGSCTALAYQI
ncbi:MAG: Rrf2 family transcriptional regulator [Kiritimatiellia bacterium]|jgi:Rrf2 family protein